MVGRSPRLRSILPLVSLGLGDTHIRLAGAHIILRRRHGRRPRLLPEQRLLRDAHGRLVVLVGLGLALLRLVLVLVRRLDGRLHRLLARALGLCVLRLVRGRQQSGSTGSGPRRWRGVGRLGLDVHRGAGHRDGVPLGREPVDGARLRRRRWW